jgi:hypothetical protein
LRAAADRFGEGLDILRAGFCAARFVFARLRLAELADLAADAFRLGRLTDRAAFLPGRAERAPFPRFRAVLLARRAMTTRPFGTLTVWR